MPVQNSSTPFLSAGLIAAVYPARRLHWLALALLMPLPARAELKLVPYGSAQYEYHSNLLDVAGADEAEALRGDRTQADSVWAAKVGLDATYRIGQQELEVTGEGRRLDYQHFSDLDHDEHTFSGRFAWKLGSEVEGTVDYRQEKQIASFEETSTLELFLQKQSTAHANLAYRITPDWTIDGGVTRSNGDFPLISDPSFALEATTESLEFKYAGRTGITMGLVGELRSGGYTVLSEDAAHFNERSVLFKLDYENDSIDYFNARAGAAQRKQASFVGDGGGGDGGSDTVNSLIGSLGYRRVVSVKTQLEFNVFRKVDSYLASTNPLVITGGSARFIWSPSRKVGFDLSYQLNHTAFKSGDTINDSRSDDAGYLTLDMAYKVANWLTFRPFAAYRDRKSSVDDQSFVDSTFGAELLARFE